MTDIKVQNCIVEQKISWISPEYIKPKAEELYLIIFSGKTNNVHYDHAISTAFYFEDEDFVELGWFIENVNNVILKELEVHYYAKVPIPSDCIVEVEK